MTRKHFERMAAVFRVNQPSYNDQKMLWSNMLDDMCIELKAINPRFDEDKFKEACNVK